MTYTVIYQRADDGTIWAYTPDLPGATGAGDTIEEANQSIRAGVEAWIEDAHDCGDEIPSPSTIATGHVTVDAA